MKTIVFGVGNYYQEQKGNLNSFGEIEVIAFSDNNEAVWNQKMDGIIVIPPDSIVNFEYDRILVMSIYVCEIYDQLLLLGVTEEKIIIWDCFYKKMLHRNLKMPETIKEGGRNRKVLIISQALGYDGGAFAAIYAASALRGSGAAVTLMVPGADKRLIEETAKKDLAIVIQPSLPYILEVDREWICRFDDVVVNLLTMVESACEISKICPVHWWIHEASVCYKTIMAQYPSCKHINDALADHIYAVSSIAMRNFNHFFGAGRCKRILSIGIPDMAGTEEKERTCRSSKIVAVIGSVNHLKAQDIFLEAVSLLDYIDETEFWVIGKGHDQYYSEKIEKMAADIKSVKMLGELTREGIHEAFQEIDVLVCASREETLSLTVIEAMMYGKVCITTDTTGIAEYIENGLNGFVIPSNDVAALKEKLEWVLKNIGSLGNVKMNARKTYEKYFSMHIFGRNLESVLNDPG